MGRSWLKPELKSAILGAALLFPLAAAPVHAATQWGSYHWSNGNIGSIKYHETYNGSTDYGNPDWKHYVYGAKNSAVNVWNDPSSNLAASYTGSLPNYFNGGSDPSDPTKDVATKKCTPAPYSVEICNDSYGNRGWLGVAQIWTSGNEILQGSVKLNDFYYQPGSSYDTGPWRAIVACQELAHTLGLSHDDETFGNKNYLTCMDYSDHPADGGEYHDYQTGVNPDPGNPQYPWGNTVPNDNDYLMLLNIYDTPNVCADGCLNALTSTSTGGTPSTWPPGKNKGNKNGKPDLIGQGNLPDFLSVDAGNSPAEWGKTIASYPDGRGMVYEREVAPGQKIITHVFRTLK